LIVLILLRVFLPACPLQTGRLLPLTEGLLPVFCPSLLRSEDVSYPKTLKIKQYLTTNNFSVNNKHLVIKSSQSTQLYITEVFCKQFSCHGYKKKPLFDRNFNKINIFWFSSITRLKQDATWHTRYIIFSV
jgi:hypothetical protein